MQTYQKQPDEREYIAIDFVNRLSDNETLSSVSVKCYDSDGNDVSSDMVESPTVSGTQVKVWIKDGTDGENYYLKVLATTSTGAILEGDLLIVVREIGK